MPKPKIAIHKFTSCDGCQLAFINAGEDLITLTQLVNITHFAEMGYVDPDAKVDIAFIEGSISTPEEQKRIKKIRENSQYVVTIGACATSGGIQALRNFADVDVWLQQVYASPQYIQSLKTSTGIAQNIKVDFEIWGCPITSKQVLTVIRDLLFGVNPVLEDESVCLECKRLNNVCVLVARGEPCLGPVTKTGCGAICPRFGRECYGCYGPKENPNAESLGRWLEGIGVLPDSVIKKLKQIYCNEPQFNIENNKQRP